jgi:hypothetical protein
MAVAHGTAAPCSHEFLASTAVLTGPASYASSQRLSLLCIKHFSLLYANEEGHVARIKNIINIYKTLVRKSEGKDHLVDLGVDGLILKIECKEIG